jgi:hypothetical protein
VKEQIRRALKAIKAKYPKISERILTQGDLHTKNQINVQVATPHTERTTFIRNSDFQTEEKHLTTATNDETPETP